MKFIDLARTSEVLRTKRRYLKLATSCMRYSVRLVAAEPPPLTDDRPRRPSGAARRG